MQEKKFHEMDAILITSENQSDTNKTSCRIEISNSTVYIISFNYKVAKEFNGEKGR